MLTVDEIEQIRRAYYCEKQSVRAIAREQHHHRQREPRPRPMVDAVRPLIDAWLEADQEAPPKQRHTAKRIFDRLVDDYGYGGKERAVREYVHDWKQAHRSDAIGYLPLGSIGDCYDNVMAESFFATLECELLNRHRFATKNDDRMAIFDYIETFYNRQRRHSALGYRSPVEYERRVMEHAG